MEQFPETRWYAIIDTAQDEVLYDYVQTCAEQECLISGDTPRELRVVLPYVVTLGEGEPLAEAWPKEGLGKNWGIAFESAASIEDLRLHFKKFLNAQLPDGTVALFRFYDPRVFRVFLKSCSPEEKRRLFQLVSRFSVEGKDRLHDFHLRDDCLWDGTVSC